MPNQPQKPLGILTRSRRVTLQQSPNKARQALPEAPEGQAWHQLALDFWDDLWDSPMAAEYTAEDVHRLRLLLNLFDKFWKASDAGKPIIGLAAEIRQESAGFGLSPLDRRRLQWEIERGETAEQKRASRKPPTEPVADPRRSLKAIS
jgi:hypothetical protein